MLTLNLKIPQVRIVERREGCSGIEDSTIRVLQSQPRATVSLHAAIS